jgi:hypothetical protein
MLAIYGDGGEEPQANRDPASQQRIHRGLDINFPRIAVIAGDVGSPLPDDFRGDLV